MSVSVQESVPAGKASYFDLDYYKRVWEIVKGWGQLNEIPAERLPSHEDYEAVVRLLYVEARLIDAGRLAEWIDLYTQDCAYWLPADADLGDPTKIVSWEFNDRRRLEERVERLGTGRAYSQAPPTRSSHLYSNIEAMTDGKDGMHVLCSFLIQTNFAGHPSSRSGWNGYILRREAGRWRIVLKRINMYDADLAQENNSFTL